MMPEPTDHRAEAEKWLGLAAEVVDPSTEYPADLALIGIGHALLALTDKPPLEPRADMTGFPGFDDNKDLCGFVQGVNRCVRTDGHFGKHHMAYGGSGGKCRGVYSDGFHSDPYRCGLPDGHKPPHLYEPPPIPRATVPLSPSED